METLMPKSSLAPAMRATVFFGLMGAAIAGLTLGAKLQIQTDQSSTTIELARGEGEQTRIIALPSQPQPALLGENASDRKRPGIGSGAG
jgi:hypothetical protein